MRVIGKDRTGCSACNPLDEIIARIEQLERRVVTIVARVQGIPPDAEGNVTLPTSSSVDGPLFGNVGAFAMSSEVKEATDDVHQYASAIADDVVVLQSDVEILTREIEALDPASVTALQQSVAALQQSVTQLSNTVAGYSAVIGDLEDQMPNKVDRTGDTMTGPLNVIDTATGSRNARAVNGDRLQNDLDAYAPMLRTTGVQEKSGDLLFFNKIGYPNRSIESTSIPSYRERTMNTVYIGANDDHRAYDNLFAFASGGNAVIWRIKSYDRNGEEHSAVLRLTVFTDGTARLQLERESGTVVIVERG